MQKRSHLVPPGLAAAVVLGGLVAAGCASRATTAKDSASPVHVERLQVGDATVPGMKLVLPDGRPFAYMIRADRGIVACPHTDIESLGRAGIPAATARNWGQRGLRGELMEKITAANAPAASLGVKPGITVEEALKLLMRQESQNPSPLKESAE